MGPKTDHHHHHRGSIRAARACHLTGYALALTLAIMAATPAHAGRNVFGADAPSGNRDAIRAQAFAESQARAFQIQAAARERLSRSTDALQGMQAAQAAARASAAALNSVANGLRPGGLEVLTGNDARWSGADAPVTSGNNVTVRQNDQQAVLHWKTFNIGRDTTLNFDQSKGGADAGKWVAFNKVFDPSGVPSQIRGRINAQGQVYIINRNGVVFGGSSQINTRALVASTLPINENLVRSGLLNNKDAQFIFSGIRVPGGSDGTPAFEPPTLPAGQKYGDVLVEKGARLKATAGQDGDGGRVMLVGANVRNEGTIDTPAGQSILAAGLQVGVRAHPENDPSLRGLDVWVGQVSDYAGRVENVGLVQSPTGSIVMAGKEVKQSGVLASTTSVNLNGRIDLLASYGAVGNPNFDSFTGSTQPPFLSQFTGTVDFAPGSVTSILPDASGKKIPGLRMAADSQANIVGSEIYFGRGSILMAPSGDVTAQAGVWPFRDTDGDGTALEFGGNDQMGLNQHLTPAGQRFLLSHGQIYLDEGSIIDVSGSVDGFVPLSQHLLTVAMRSSELADSPLQRNSALRGVPLVVDLRETGVDSGRSWVGTPLGDLSGYLAIIERDISQLTARGGTVSLSAGDSIAMQHGATIDVSGGLLRHGAGRVQTSMLALAGRAVPITSAYAEVEYDGVYSGTATVTSKWLGAKTYSSGVFNPAKGFDQNSYFEGAPAGTAAFKAPSLALAGNLNGKSYVGPDQREAPPALGSLRLAFLGEKDAGTAASPAFVEHSPYPPLFRMTTGRSPPLSLPSFELVSGEPFSLPARLRGTFALGVATFSEEEGGFGNLEVENAEGDFVVPAGTRLGVQPGGKVDITAQNVRVDGLITSRGGRISLTAYNYSPYAYAELSATGALADKPAPAVQRGSGSIVLGGSARLDVSGTMVDDRSFSLNPNYGPVLSEGGSIRLEGYSLTLPSGSLLDASGGVYAGSEKAFSFGDGGSIEVLSGRDPELATTVGGSLVLNGTLQAYSGARGGKVKVQSNFIRLGEEEGAFAGLNLPVGFFQSGGFSSYDLVGLGGRDSLGRTRPGVVVDGTIAPKTLALAPIAGGSKSLGSFSLGPDIFGLVLPEFAGERQAVSLALTATGFDDGFTENKIEALGIVEILAGSRITLDAGSSVSLKGDVVRVNGTIEAPGGSISIAGRSSYRLSPLDSQIASAAQPTVEIGSTALLLAAGMAVGLPDQNGLRAGMLFPGGTISISGNVLAERGAIFDVRGSSTVLDFSPQRLGFPQINPKNPLNVTLGLSARIDSDGGSIKLAGSQMLYSDATLLGSAGGPSALGGTLSVSSGRFYSSGENRSGADINMLVAAQGSASDFRHGEGAKGMGFFAVDSFSSGGFDSLDLGYFYLSDASPVPYGGNVEFRGDLAVETRGQLRLAGGGIIRAGGNVLLSAPVIALGQPYSAPLNPSDPNQPFRRFDAGTGGTAQVFITPESGQGTFMASARHIDTGNLVLDGIGSASLTATSGDIRGYGSLNMAGDLKMEAARIYPTTLGNFDLFAFNNSVSGSGGSIIVLSSGSAGAPVSAGGALRLFAEKIGQQGTLRAPLGSITLGWDGSGTAPENAVTGRAASMSVTASLVLAASSTTSVAADGLTIPFGLSQNGLNWVDPRGVDVTTGGLPHSAVVLSAGSISASEGSVVDLRGGGDLLAYRWIPGIGGSSDLLGAASTAWKPGANYNAGDLVLHKGATWSARLDIDPSAYAVIPEPKEGLFWLKIPEAFAVLPGLSDRNAPLGAFNTGLSSGALGGDPGYVASGLPTGQLVHLAGVPGLASGYHTLLPRRYALLPGSFLVIPEEGKLTGSGTVISSRNPSMRNEDFLTSRVTRSEEGSYLASGWSLSGFQPASTRHAVQTRFEVLPRAIVAGRAQHDLYGANEFLSASAKRLGLSSTQRLPRDAARLAVHGNTAMSLAGTVHATTSSSEGRPANIDLSSLAAITIAGRNSIPPEPGSVTLSAALLNSWGFASLMVGGQRSENGVGTAVQTLSPSVTLDTAGEALTGPDITLAARTEVVISSESELRAKGALGGPAQKLDLDADGALVRVSTDSDAAIRRVGKPTGDIQKVVVGPAAGLSGASVIIDSTYATDLNPSSEIRSGSLALGSGQISIALGARENVSDDGDVAGHLVLGGAALARASQSDVLRLLSYRTIDLYGDGTLGSSNLERLELLAAGVRGFEADAAGAVIEAEEVYFARPDESMMDLALSGSPQGRLSLGANRLLLGPGSFSVRGYEAFAAAASGGVMTEATGALQVIGDALFAVPTVTGQGGTSYEFNATGRLAFERSGKSAVSPGLGASLSLQGSSVDVSSDILLPSGLVSLAAATGDIEVSGRLVADGQASRFFDVTRYTDGGSIDLSARQGSVKLLAGSLVSVAAHREGGDAGHLNVRSPGGSFETGGTLDGSAGAGGQGGSFALDAGSVADFDELRQALDTAGFFQERNLRVRSGDVTVAGRTRVHTYSLSADAGDITVTGTIDASGETGGRISLITGRNLTLAGGSVLLVSGEKFSSAGKGGHITLEAGSAIDGVANASALLDLRAGSIVDLSVAEFASGPHTSPGSSAFYGWFEGTLHLRAPRVGNEVGIAEIGSSVIGGSSVLAEAFRIYEPVDGVMNRALRDGIHADNAAFMSAAAPSVLPRLLAASSGLDDVFVLAPGVEIVNRSGDLVLGLANVTGSANIEALSDADWDLSSWRYGSRMAPGVLTLRAAGDLVFNNALSDGFAPVAKGGTSEYAAKGHSLLWLAPLQTINAKLPANTQSWSYRLASGADFGAADFRRFRDLSSLDAAVPGRGSVLIGEFFAAPVPNTGVLGSGAGAGRDGKTANTIRINNSLDNADKGTRFEVVRTGTGNIEIAAGRDLQLRNAFAGIYSAGAGVRDRTSVYSQGDFSLPVTTPSRHPDQGGVLGATQQDYAAYYGMAGGDLRVSSGRDIGRFGQRSDGTIGPDSSLQMPSHWLYRRGLLDPSTGRFAPVTLTGLGGFSDPSASTTWWIDYSNFFQGFGALGGGNISLSAARHVINADAAIPTVARAAGLSVGSAINSAPDATKLLETGGGDLRLRAGGNLDGGSFYVERGQASLHADGEITTNEARSLTPWQLTPFQRLLDQSTWQAVMLFGGRSTFEATARGDVLLGPATSAFLLPQGLNNKFWYKTQFHTVDPSAGVTAKSVGGSVTHRFGVTLPGDTLALPVLEAAYRQGSAISPGSAAYYRPWLRLAETGTGKFRPIAAVGLPSLRSTAFGGDIKVVGRLDLIPSALGELELLASGAIPGLSVSGRTRATAGGASTDVDAWTAARINLSDADPSRMPSPLAPLGIQQVTGSTVFQTIRDTSDDPWAAVSLMFRETGAFQGDNGTTEIKSALHAAAPVHAANPNPVRLYAGSGDLSGLTLFSAKKIRALAARDITDVAIYLQHTAPDDISIVSAGRDIIPFNEESALRVQAENLSEGNLVIDEAQDTVLAGADGLPVRTKALSGDIQVGGRGALQVLAGRNIDFGSGANFVDGTGVGITSIGRQRNPFLPFEGAHLFVLAGVGGAGGGPAAGLAASTLNFDGQPPSGFLGDTPEHRALGGLRDLFTLLKKVGTEAATSGSYDAGYKAVEGVFGDKPAAGELATRARDLRTTSGGSITAAAPGGRIAMASDIFGNPLTPPGIVTEYGGAISILTGGNVDIGRARIFTLRGGDLTIWSSQGDIAAGTAPKTVVTAPPTRILIDSISAAVETDLGGLATGGGIGVLASVAGVEPGAVTLLAPRGTVDAGDAGIRATGNITIAASQVRNADNIAAGGVSSGVPASPGAAAPSIGGLNSASSSTAATTQAASDVSRQAQSGSSSDKNEPPSTITVEVLGYGGDEEEEERQEASAAAPSAEEVL